MKKINHNLKNVFTASTFGVLFFYSSFLVIAFIGPSSIPTSLTDPVNDLDVGTFSQTWIASSSGDASVALTETACNSASDWEWFEDANGDGDTTDFEDGVCVQVVATSSISWNGYDYTTNPDNTYIADYDCEGSFPNGVVKSGTYNGLDSGGSADTTWNQGDCALCQADCIDGRKDLPDQGSYTSNPGGTGGLQGPITSEVLKNWKGTRLPTKEDFFGFCGYKDGGSDYETGCSSTVTHGDYGTMVGRTDECLDLSNSGYYEWLSEKHTWFGPGGLEAGYNACSYTYSSYSYTDVIFRGVFRP